MRRGWLLTVFLPLGFLAVSIAFAAETAPPNDVKKAEHFLEKLEKHVERAGGKPFKLTYDDTQAVKRIADLKKKYPEDPAVLGLAERAAAAYMASTGEHIRITEEMLKYRKNEKILVERVAAKAREKWDALLESARTESGMLDKAFPGPEPKKADPEQVIGKYVVLEGFRYPDNEFMDMGRQYLFVGSGAKGYYFVQLSGRQWLGAYEALKRYRRQVSQDTPTPWTLLGKIADISMLIPEAGEEKHVPPAYGWIVDPVAIHLPGKLTAWADPALELGGEYSAEAELNDIKRDMYTYTEVPDDVTPIELVTIFATAIKEKNWGLYLDCIDPARRKTPTAIQRLQYFYDNNLERYARWYVYVQPVEQKPVLVLKGVVVEKGSDIDILLSDAQKETLRGREQEVVEEARVVIKTYDELGKQTAFPKDVVLRRYDGGRWYISSGYPL
jgi:hypothetical protein